MADGENERHFESLDAPIRGCIHSNAPVVGEGTVAGRYFAFRARGEGWIFAIVDEPDQSALSAVFGSDPPEFVRMGEYGTSPYAASWMPYQEAEEIIVACAREFLAAIGTDTSSEFS